jgi:REP element-mobilizing transposase RayT
MNRPDNHPHRRSLRLQGYDYSQAGAYFVTICAQGRECLFGGIENGEMVLNEHGCVVRDEWSKTAEIRTGIETGEFVVMPNHFHGIVIIAESVVGVIDERAIHDNQ